MDEEKTIDVVDDQEDALATAAGYDNEIEIDDQADGLDEETKTSLRSLP